MTSGGGAEKSAEVILEDGSTCTMPDLPPPGRSFHSATGLTLCGGLGGESTCSTFTGQWETSHKLNKTRWGHVSWDSPTGIHIIGGMDNDASRTIEILSPNFSTIISAVPPQYPSAIPA